MLEDLLSLTRSAYGFIGEILHDDDGTRFLKTHAITTASVGAAGCPFAGARKG